MYPNHQLRPVCLSVNLEGSAATVTVSEAVVNSKTKSLIAACIDQCNVMVLSVLRYCSDKSVLTSSWTNDRSFRQSQKDRSDFLPFQENGIKSKQH